MAKYSASGVCTASVAVPRSSLTVTGGTNLRPKVYDILFGCSSTPADVQVTHTAQRTTAAGTNTAVTPEPLETDDRAATCAAGQTHTLEPTFAGVAWIILPIHARASFRWVARTGGELIISRTSGHGIGVKKTAETSGTATINTTIMWEE